MNEALKIRALIVDDEKAHRGYILECLESHPEVEVLGECPDGYAAIAAIRERVPDLVFLDVQMPEIDGFDVLKALAPGSLPLVIFVTVFDKYAVRAFEFSAVDYLLKPFNQERFDKALQKAKHTLATEKSGKLTERVLALLDKLGDEPKLQSRHLEWIVIHGGARDILIRTEEIDWIDASGKNTWIHVGQKTYLSPKTIGALEAQLDPRRFVRCHRSYIVNINLVEELIHPADARHKVALKNGVRLSLSDSGRERIKKLLGDGP